MFTFTSMANPGKIILSTIILFLFFIGAKNSAFAQTTVTKCDLICGKWMLSEKNLIIEIYKDNGQFKAKIIWFDDSDDKTRPMETRMDTANPDVKLRTQKILGSSVLQKLVYNPNTNTWEDGIIYDANHGRSWQSAAFITPEGTLKVTGYWHFKWIGKTLDFSRVQPTVVLTKLNN